MNKLKLKAYAKINLSLDVLNKRDDGYHNVEMIMQQIGLYDEIYLKKIDKGIIIDTDCEYLPIDKSNIVYKAAKIIIDKYKLNTGIYIYIKKNIPIAAGLAGGSTDAAAVLKGINTMFSLGLTTDKLLDIGKEIGADVPFCILGGAALAEGIGEKLTQIHGLKSGWIVLSKPNIGVSTADAYNNLNLNAIENRPDTEKLIVALENGNIYDISKLLCNVFEEGIFEKHPIVKKIKTKMIQYGALGCLMSGSGPTVFGIYKTYARAKSAYEKLKLIYNQTYLVRTHNGRQ